MNDLLEQSLCFLTVIALFNSRIAGHTGVFLDRTETNDLISIIDQLIYEPVQCKVGVVILICSAEEGPASSCTLISFMFVVERQ